LKGWGLGELGRVGGVDKQVGSCELVVVSGGRVGRKVRSVGAGLAASGSFDCASRGVRVVAQDDNSSARGMTAGPSLSPFDKLRVRVRMTIFVGDDSGSFGCALRSG
jgi:hypothetical protein